MLNENQKDLLTELVNVYVGQAANVLSELVNQRIQLNIPHVELITTNELKQDDPKFSIFFNEGHLITSSLKFGHDFSGKAILMFPAEQAKLFVNTCTGEITSELDANTITLLDTDIDVLKEVSNIILNAIIGEFGNFLEVKLEYALPDVEFVAVSTKEKVTFLKNEVHILVLQTSFLLADANLKGAIVIALSMDSISSLINKIDEFLESSYE